MSFSKKISQIFLLKLNDFALRILVGAILSGFLAYWWNCNDETSRSTFSFWNINKKSNWLQLLYSQWTSPIEKSLCDKLCTSLFCAEKKPNQFLPYKYIKSIPSPEQQAELAWHKFHHQSWFSWQYRLESQHEMFLSSMCLYIGYKMKWYQKEVVATMD